MDPKTTNPSPTPTATATSTSTITTQGPPPASTPGPSGAALPAQVLEISIISAQDLTPLYKSMRTYAVTWINPNEKFTTRTDQHHTSPTWNDKFTFNVDIQALFAAEAALHIEIYTVSWFRHVLVGTVKVRISDLLSPAIRVQHNTRFVALQVRRPSGTPQGILNMGVTFHDHSLRAMFRHYDHDNFSEIDRKSHNPYHQENDNHKEDDGDLGKKILLWRRSSSESEINHHDFPLKAGSVCNGSMINGSMVNGSELCSDIGPSASIVAADLAMKLQPPHPHPPPVMRRRVINYDDANDSGSSIVGELTMEQVMAKGYRSRTRTTGDRWRRVVYEDDESDLSTVSSHHSRRNSDGGLFSCLVYGIEFRVACGASGNSGGGNKHGNAAVRRKEIN